MRTVVSALSVLLVAVVAAVAFAQDPGTEPAPPAPTPVATETVVATATPVVVDPGAPPDDAEIVWHHSKALGKPFYRGRLVNGVQLPELGEDFFSWDPVYNRIPNRPWR